MEVDLPTSELRSSQAIQEIFAFEEKGRLFSFEIFGSWLLKFISFPLLFWSNLSAKKLRSKIHGVSGAIGGGLCRPWKSQTMGPCFSAAFKLLFRSSWFLIISSYLAESKDTCPKSLKLSAWVFLTIHFHRRATQQKLENKEGSSNVWGEILIMMNERQSQWVIFNKKVLSTRLQPFAGTGNNHLYRILPAKPIW